uniref:Musashi RNA-binding protein 2a n=1 Tax=Seriola dumerili TaxID=41447 RepID=A0A3B4UNZ9_SERDU
MEGDGSQATSGSLNDSQHDPGKMFIGGLSWQTSPDSLRDYFSKFGEIRECMVMRDPTTKRSRGFGFVTFTDAASVDKVLAQQHHELDSKTIDPKVAFPRRAQPKMVTRTKKIFVGGLSANTVVEDVKQYFEQFGKTPTETCDTVGLLADHSSFFCLRCPGFSRGHIVYTWRLSFPPTLMKVFVQLMDMQPPPLTSTVCTS